MNIAVILSGGSGSRMGTSTPKQYLIVKGKPVIEYAIDVFLNHGLIDILVICASNEWIQFIDKIVRKLDSHKQVFYAESGSTRQGSIINAFKVVKELVVSDEDVVLIHEAARPLLSKELITRCLDAMSEADAVLPVVPVKNTTYLSSDGKSIDSLLNRSQLWSGQAPEVFRFGRYYSIIQNNKNLLTLTGGTEAAFRAGLKCVLVEGEEKNFKITTQKDLVCFEAILESE